MADDLLLRRPTSTSLGGTPLVTAELLEARTVPEIALVQHLLLVLASVCPAGLLGITVACIIKYSNVQVKSNR